MLVAVRILVHPIVQLRRNGDRAEDDPKSNHEGGKDNLANFSLPTMS
jgi:hypothetical protein